MIGYKIVEASFLRGLFSLIQIGDARVKYELNKPVYPNNGYGPLCVFATLEDVSNFSDSGYSDLVYSEKVFEVEYEPSLDAKIWNQWGENYLDSLPSGTRLAKSVTLLREVF